MTTEGAGPGAGTHDGLGSGGDAAGGHGAPTGDIHDRARQGAEHLQAAARELIAAARAALDVAEEVVNDPESLVAVAGVVATVGDLVRRFAGAGQAPGPAPDGAPPEPDAPRVEHITVD